MADKPLETRTVTADIEVREADSSGLVNIEGYATTFGQEYDMGAFRELVHPDAFTRTLSTNPDVRFLVDHAGQPLARTKSGTLTLTPDSTGMHMRAGVDPSDPDVQRLLPKMRRGDLDQMSFAFRVPTGGDEWSEDYGLRTLREINMAGGDVSVVTYPANPNTTVSVRSQDVRDAQCVFAATMVAELRAGNTVGADNMAQLKKVLDLIAAADDAVDEAQVVLSAALGVANPDDDGQANSGRPLGLALAVAQRLGIPA